MPRKRKSIIQKLPLWLQVSLIILAIILLLFLNLGLVLQVVFSQKVYPNIKVANINLGGKTALEAAAILQEVPQKQPQVIKLNYEGQNWQLKLTDLGLSYLATETGRRAYLAGRSGNLKKDVYDLVLGLRGKVNLDFNYQLNEALLEAALASLSAQIDIPSISPAIQLTKDGSGKSMVVIQTGQPGRKVDQSQTKQMIKQCLGQVQELTIALPVNQELSKLSEQQAEITKTRAEKLLAKSLTLSFEENSWTLKEAELINFLGFNGDFNNQKIAEFTAQLAQSIDRSPENALFNFQNGRVVEFKPAKDGQTFDQTEAIKLILASLKELETKEKVTLNLEAAVKLTKPAVSNEDVNRLGIKELLGRGESWFAGSISSRIHNIQLASAKINGLLVAPGETFSLNQALGDVSAQTGFQQAYVIKEGRTVLGDGGGVCQVSTTLFRAVLRAGLPVEERQAHAYRVGYYEQKYQVGVDATVFAPSPDFKFKNDTPAHILIQTSVDINNVKLTYDLYGTGDGRQITISPSRIWEQVAPPPDLYQDDPTLAAGVVKQVDWSAWGAKVAFDWKVMRGDEVLQNRTFYSYYKPWQAVFLRGTAEQ